MSNPSDSEESLNNLSDLEAEDVNNVNTSDSDDGEKTNLVIEEQEQNEEVEKIVSWEDLVCIPTFPRASDSISIIYDYA